MSNDLNDYTDRELLEIIYERQEEDRLKINKLYKRARLQWVFAILKWIIYIAIAVGIYAYLQPFIENIINTYSSLQESASSLGEIRKNLSDIPSFPFF